MFTAFDILLILVSFSFLMTGLYRNRTLIRKASETGAAANWPALVSAVFRQKKIMARPLVGIAHLVLVWGFILFLLVVIAAQFNVSVGRLPARMISWLLDSTGLAMLIATVFFLVRRIRLRSSNPGNRCPHRTIFPMLLLLLILISGFVAEGSRLNLPPSHTAADAPVGWLFAAALPTSPLFMQLMVRLHIWAVLGFIAAIPFTFMRHLADAAANIFRSPSEAVFAQAPLNLDHPPFGARSVLQFDADRLIQSSACVGCRRCDEVCPARESGKLLSPAGILSSIRGQIDFLNGHGGATGETPAPLSADESVSQMIWSCTTCMACVAQCPTGVAPMDKIIALRQYQVLDRGQAPKEARPMLRHLERYGDVTGKGAAYRPEWGIDCEVEWISENGHQPRLLLWSGCSGAFHPAYQQTLRAMVKILKAAGVPFGVLAHDEQCCGDPARRLGDESIFRSLAQHNIRTFRRYGIQRIIALCPHCYHTLKNEYPALGFQAEVLHAVVFVRQLLAQGLITLKYPFEKTVVIQDPCYLGRYNGIYQPLRDLCEAVPGLTLRELPRHGENGFCCGGGGGQMWLHEAEGEKINLLRAREAAQSDADVVCTACPYCLTMMADGINALEQEHSPKVIDMIELVAESIA